MRKAYKISVNVLEWIFLISMFVFLIFSVSAVVKSSQTGEDAYVFGYRPLYILSGSMEPTLKTDGIIISKKVECLSEIAEGDIITFHISSEDNSVIKVTHRVHSIDTDGNIRTKGDNNVVVDSEILSIDNVESKTVFIFNQSAQVINLWRSSLIGKIIVILVPIFIIVFLYLMKRLIILKFQET